MKKTLLAGIALSVLGASAATAGVIDDRQTIMKGFNTANNDLLLLTKDTYSPATVGALLQVISGGAAKLGALFPAGSGTDTDSGTGTGTDTAQTRALPAVWSDAPGFQAALAKLSADVKAVEGTKDAASFGLAYYAVAADCNDCHRTYRARPPRAPR